MLYSCILHQIVHPFAANLLYARARLQTHMAIRSTDYAPPNKWRRGHERESELGGGTSRAIWRLDNAKELCLNQDGLCVLPFCSPERRLGLAERFLWEARHANEFASPFPEGKRIQLTGRAGLPLPSFFHNEWLNAELRAPAAEMALAKIREHHPHAVALLAQPSIQLPTGLYKRSTAGRPHRESERTPLPSRDASSGLVGYTGFINFSSSQYMVWVATGSHEWADAVEEGAGGAAAAGKRSTSTPSPRVSADVGDVLAMQVLQMHRRRGKRAAESDGPEEEDDDEEEEEDDNEEDDRDTRGLYRWTKNAQWLQHRRRILLQPGEMLLMNQRLVRSYPSEIKRRERMLMHVAFLASREASTPIPRQVIDSTRYSIENGDIPRRLPNGSLRCIFAAVTRADAQLCVIDYATHLKRRCTRDDMWRIKDVVRPVKVPMSSLPSLVQRRLPPPVYKASQLRQLGLVVEGSSA